MGVMVIASINEKKYRYGNSDSELEKEFSDDTLHEDDRYEDRQDRHRCRDRGESYLPRPDQSRVYAGLPLLLVARDVLQDHDSVIDDDTYDQ